MAEEVKKWISQESFTEKDSLQTQDLFNCLDKEYHSFENEEQKRHRERVIQDLEKIIQAWAKEVMREQGKDENLIENTRCKIWTFGSYRLGVHSPGTDIDTLIVGPSAIDRTKHFFGNLVNILQATEGIEKVTPVPYT